MGVAGYNPKIGKIKTDVPGLIVDRAFLAHFQVAATDAVAADTEGVHAAVACTTPAVSATCTVTADSDPGDTLTVTAPATIGAAANDLSINLITAEDDNLAVTADDETGVITIALAKESAAKNTNTLIQAAIQLLGEVAGVDVSGFTCTAGGNWNSAAIATGETDVVPFEGGQTAAPDVITTNLVSPKVPRNITVTAGGTAGDIGAVAVIIEGTNCADEPITETLPAFTAATAATKEGSKAFKTVTKVTIPAHNGTGATTKIGWGDKLGLPYKLVHNTVLAAYLDNVRETTAPTVAVSATALESNTIELYNSLNGKVVDAYLLV